jgi:hypothetical protein
MIITVIMTEPFLYYKTVITLFQNLFKLEAFKDMQFCRFLKRSSLLQIPRPKACHGELATCLWVTNTSAYLS